MFPTNSILIPWCSSFLPSRGLIVTCKTKKYYSIYRGNHNTPTANRTLPVTVSPSMYSGNLSRRSLSTFTSTSFLCSSPLKRISTSTGALSPNKAYMFKTLWGFLTDIQEKRVWSFFKNTYSDWHIHTLKKTAKFRKQCNSNIKEL